MRTLLLLSAMVLAAGSAEACLPSQSAQRDAKPQAVEQRLGGSVLLQERPLPGTVVPMPDMASPIRGRHGGQLA